MTKSEPGHILVVDHEPIQRLLLARTLKQQGHVVHSAEDGEQALAMLAEGSFDVVLCEIEMPGMDGFEVLERLKGDASLRDIPVVMVSGLGEQAGVVACIEMGAADYLHKPFDAALLRARVENCLAKRRSDLREGALYRELEEKFLRLQELESQRDSLMHMIVHDLRTPLTALITGLQMAECIGTLDDDQKECIDISVSGGEKLLAMVNDLLDISKMESGTLSLEFAPLDARSLVLASLAQVEPLAREKKVALNKHVPDEMPGLVADEGKLSRVLVNLLGNAIKFTPQGGEVTVSAEYDPRPDRSDAFVFSVADTGEGIPRESFGKVFEKFGQVESRKGGRRSSSGLGLTFCKIAVEAHGGRIWFNSMHGFGSTFYMAVPAGTSNLSKPAK